MTTLFFVVPAAGRVTLTEVCLRQLSRTCGELAEKGIQASAVVIADDENLETARDVGFATVERGNECLGARVNDGFEAAGLEGVDFVITLGSDDWVDASWVASFLPAPDVVRCSREMSMVDETGSRLSTLELPYAGGHGIRMFPRALLEQARFRPAEEFACRSVDFSILKGLGRAAGHQTRLVYVDDGPFRVVDWKSPVVQLTPSESWRRYEHGEPADPFEVLSGFFPAESLDEMAAVYERVAVVV